MCETIRKKLHHHLVDFFFDLLKILVNVKTKKERKILQVTYAIKVNGK